MIIYKNQIYLNKKWLKKKKKGSSDSDSDSDKSDSDSSKSDSSKSDSSKSSSESESEDEDEIPKFNPKIANTGIKFTKKDRIATSGSSGWQTCLATKSTKYSIKVLSGCQCFMLGFATKDIKLSGSNYESNGYYFYIYNGTLYSQGGDWAKAYSTKFGSTANTIYGAAYDKKKRNSYFLYGRKELRCCLERFKR